MNQHYQWAITNLPIKYEEVEDLKCCKLQAEAVVPLSE